MYRVLLSLRKGEQVKYLSHRNVIRAFEFALRRACIPMAYSAGFNPRPRMSFGSAIGVGVISEDERILIELVSPMEPSEVGERLNAAFPTGLQVLSAEAVPEGEKSPISGLNASRFRFGVECGAGCSLGAICEAAQKLLAQSEVRVTRVREGKTREVDIRPYLLDSQVTESKGDTIVLEVILKQSDSGGAGPQDFMQALWNLVPNLKVKYIQRLEQLHTGSQPSASC